MTKEELIENACSSLDEITAIVDKFIISSKRGNYFLYRGKKADIYKAIADIQEIVHRIDELPANELYGDEVVNALMVGEKNE